MEIATVEMNQYQARRKFLEYRAACRERQTAEDKAIMAGYKALSQGRKVLHIGQVMQEAGVNYLGQPELAIIRADATKVYFESYQWRHKIGSKQTTAGETRGGHVFATSNNAFSDKRLSTHRVVIPQDAFPAMTRRISCEASVPMIPPQFRPKGSLENYYILWDAKWDKKAPLDPLLLKPISPLMYAIVAMWDLTPLERAIMAGGRIAGSRNSD